MTAEKDTLIAIGVHAHWAVDFDVYFNHCKHLMEWNKHHQIRFLGYKGLLAADAREMMLEQAIKDGCSSIFVLDADHIIPIETLDLLLENKDEAMVSGLVCRRFYPFGQVGFGKFDKKGSYVPIDLPLDGKIYQVGVCAFGCTLVNLEKIQKLKKPWFRDTCGEAYDGTIRNTRSDVNLCNAFRENGENVWIDTRILVIHTGTELFVAPQNARDLGIFRHRYLKSFDLRTGQEGFFDVPSRAM